MFLFRDSVEGHGVLMRTTCLRHFKNSDREGSLHLGMKIRKTTNLLCFTQNELYETL